MLPNTSENHQGIFWSQSKLKSVLSDIGGHDIY